LLDSLVSIKIVDDGFDRLLDVVPAFLSPRAAPLWVNGKGDLDSAFNVTDLAVASMATAAMALSDLVSGGEDAPPVTVDRDLASHWFAMTIRPQAWALPSPWDPIAGDYEASDGWIRLHTNAPKHRAAALAVLGVDGDRDAVARAVRAWSAEELETAVVNGGGAAAMMRSLDEWRVHPQGAAVAEEPLLQHILTDPVPGARELRGVEAGRPLRGVRVLDLTRVLAGPVATRLLAGWGADVLRIDPPDWDEPAIVPEVLLGKRAARLDLKSGGRDVLIALLAQADIVVHGYRANALARLGLGPQERQEIRPGLVDVSLDAYGFTGPWAQRRGFDSLVQMSSGIAHHGMVVSGQQRPVPLPLQAIDHATGYLLAGAAIAGLNERIASGRGSVWLASLARTARWLVDGGVRDRIEGVPLADAIVDPNWEMTAWGPARRVHPPLSVEGFPLQWARPARDLGSFEAAW
jgi:hypothetical protein